MPFYTRKGDEGYTDLLGSRVPKYDPRPEVIGALDETTSSIGLGRSLARSERTRAILVDVQRDLYTLMAELAFTVEQRRGAHQITPEMVARVEAETDGVEAEVDLPPHFILPGDTVAGAALDVARTVVRRAERQLVRLAHDGAFENEAALAYLNRLSSLLFILARFEDAVAGVTPTRAKAT